MLNYNGQVERPKKAGLGRVGKCFTPGESAIVIALPAGSPCVLSIMVSAPNMSDDVAMPRTFGRDATSAAHCAFEPDKGNDHREGLGLVAYISPKAPPKANDGNYNGDDHGEYTSHSPSDRPPVQTTLSAVPGVEAVGMLKIMLRKCHLSEFDCEAIHKRDD